MELTAEKMIALVTDGEALETLKEWTLREQSLRDRIRALRSALSEVGLKFENEDGNRTDPFLIYESFRIWIRFDGQGWLVRLAEPYTQCRAGSPLETCADTVAGAVESATPTVLALFAEMEERLAHFRRVVAVASEKIVGKPAKYCVFCQNTGVHDCPGGRAKRRDPATGYFTAAWRPIVIPPGMVDADACSVAEWERCK
jgi:hypothetical protein